MKKWSGGVILGFLFTLLILRYGILENPLAERVLERRFSRNSSEHLDWLASGDPPAIQNPGDRSSVVSAEEISSHLFAPRNLSDAELRSLQTWNHLDHLVSHASGLPQAVEAIGEAGFAWESLMAQIEDKKLNKSTQQKHKNKQCPYSIKKMNAAEFANDTFKLKIPCGLIQGSSITLIGTPGGLLGDFHIDLLGTALPGEPDPPIIFHYNVRLSGDKLTEDPVIVQNTWSATNDWGAEERCPSSDADTSKKVDDLEECSAMVGNDDKRIFASNQYQNISKSASRKEGDKKIRYFPFKQGYLSIATLRVGIEGIQMTVDGRHVTSFAFRESLEPWLVSEVRISGDIKLISVLASGLPTSEDLEHVIDLELLKSNPIPLHQTVDLFIGIFSTANNFKRRMAVRRTWMQYDAVRAGTVVVRFFVGLHKNQVVNEELWTEANTYGDIQLMPFVDYYGLITLKTIAICIYGTNVVSAKYIMKTDDDAFVRVDEVLSSLVGTNITTGLLYGRINSESQPHRNVESKWFVSPQEWPDEKYPPWAHGPGYVVSHDIAAAVYKQHKEGQLKMFKLEDVAMGIWIDEMRKKGSDIKYLNEGRILIDGCEMGYVLAHYQEPREMLCLWQKLQETKRARCCE
ncbi:beta-1,3-galactosyltransferase GALT1 [Canna indica]|uniref:Beta-1,3-galactosyltransferase GALT1 n=1 Tax=Canna indica TaxID=4628 RepID=A0AAQ3Q2M7_9LILI|nr:beta-1,3-galactosyltransferase GALT1 [Canna indica]